MSTESTSRRKSAAKYRGGCSTCRLRHVRCDQKRPRCTPCQKSTRLCEYSTDLVSLTSDPLKVVLWQPNDPSFKQQPQTSFGDPEEDRALHYFRTVVAGKLGGSFDARFWNRVALQVSHSVSPLRHAVVALATLWESQHVADPKEQAKMLALQHYASAISDMRQSLCGEGRPSMEEILMINIFFVCLELLQSHYESALRHMAGGLYLFCDWQANLRNAGSAATSRKASNGDELQTSLMNIFRRAMVQSLLFIDTHFLDKRMLVTTFTPPMPSMPDSFNSFDEARDYLQACTCSMVHGSVSAITETKQSGSTNDTTPRPVFRIQDAILKKWYQAFDLLRRRSNEHGLTERQRASHILEIQYIAMSILAFAFPLRSEVAFDAKQSEFSRILALAALIIDGDAQAQSNVTTSNLTFDMGLLAPVYMAASRCRHPLIRRQAVKLLRQSQRREGVWNSMMLANMAERIISIEESARKSVMVVEDVPATARLTLLNATISTSTDKLLATFARRSRNGAGDFEVLREEISF